MPYNRPIELKVANWTDFSIYIAGLFVLTVLSAALSSQPVPLIIFTIILFAAVWVLFSFILEICKLNELKLISVIFPSGKVSIKSDRELIIEGFLGGQHWCTSHLTVLRYETEGGFKRVVILSKQQNDRDYRRLKVCLQKDFCNDASKPDVSGNWPARRV